MSLKIASLGGMGNVTQNMYLYISGKEILIVDCGIGFPTQAMPGVDVMIPDITYLKELLDDGSQIVGMILTHGHDDHIAATPYILPELPLFPIYASTLTAGFATERILDGGIDREITVFQDGVPFKIGQDFVVTGFPVTHSVPDTRHFAIKTPAGTIYHGTDFKIDLQPVDGVLPDFTAMAKVGSEGVVCMLMDCLRVERQMWGKSESAVRLAIEESMFEVEGKYIMTLMSSHIHRIQQTVDVALQMGRKVAFIGRSVERNVQVALRLQRLHIPSEAIVDKRDLADHKSKELCIIIAGSQGQEGSSLMRAVFGEHQLLTIEKKDRVVFSSDAIPGNEIPYYTAIDELSRNQIRVLYPDVLPDIHQSGHGGAMEQQMLLSLVKPRYVMPIGGQDRHREKFHELVAEKLGYKDSEILVPISGEIIEFDHDAPARVCDHFHVGSRLIDGLGVGDVGHSVLSDRIALGREGMIVLVIPKIAGRLEIGSMEVVSRGFVFMKEAAEVIEFIKTTVAETVSEVGESAKQDDLKRAIERRLTRKLYKIIKRSPMILPVFVEG